MSFRILSLSGGGYLGLYTAEILAGIEAESSIPLHRRFDLIAGTSIGGILALALASGKSTMSDAVQLMRKEGRSIFGDFRPVNGKMGPIFDLWTNRKAARYNPDPLKSLITEFVGEDIFIANLKQRVIVPAVNVTKGSPQVFKTPHHPTFIRDWKLPLADVALATSAAPSFFPLHTIGHERFADGGLYANSPDDLALHEALHFLRVPIEEVSVLSIGTTTSKFNFPGHLKTNLSWLDWMKNKRLIGAMMAAQQINTDYIMKHRLGDRYIRVDAAPSADQSAVMSIDNASDSVASDLLGLAEASLRVSLPAIKRSGFLDHETNETNFMTNPEIRQHFLK